MINYGRHCIISGLAKTINEVLELQPYATLLLEAFVGLFHSNAVVSPGQGVRLEGTLMVGEDIRTAVKKTVKGSTDLIVYKDDASDDIDASNAICIFELKTPKGKLYHRAAGAAKDQLLFEMEILGQMGCKPSMLMGGLTDLFAIAIAVRKVVDGVCTFYVSRHATGLQEFIKLLLLLLCRDQDSIWELLLNQSINDDIVFEKDENEVQQEEAGLLEREDSSSGDLCKDKAVIALNKFRDIDRIDEYKEDVSWLISWDNKRKGLATLTRDALNKMNTEHSKSSGARYVNKFFPSLV